MRRCGRTTARLEEKSMRRALFGHAALLIRQAVHYIPLS